MRILVHGHIVIHIGQCCLQSRSVYPPILEIQEGKDQDHSHNEIYHPKSVNPSPSPPPRVESLCISDLDIVIVINITVDIDVVRIQVVEQEMLSRYESGKGRHVEDVLIR